jgi:hypothetical protein
MADVALHEFIDTYREELIARCHAKVGLRSPPPASTGEQARHGVPVFLEQLIHELEAGPSQTLHIATAAADRGRDMLAQGFTAADVVHDYGDICQSVTELAVELDAPISTEDFRTLNRCLDDAIASAVTAYGQQADVDQAGGHVALRILINIAINGFEVLQTGTVGIGGRTADLVHRSLHDIRAQLGGRPAPIAEVDQATITSDEPR